MSAAARPGTGIRTLVFYVVLCHLAYGGARVATSLAGLHLKATPLAIGIILSFFNLLPMVLSISAGRLIDRLGVAAPTTYSVAALTLGIALPFIAWDIGVLYLAAVLSGTGFMLMHLCMQKTAGEVGREGDRAANFSLLALGFSVSGFLGPMVAGFTIDHLGYREAFGVLAAAPLIAFLGFRRARYPDSLKGHDTAEAPDATPKRVLDLVATPEMKRLYAAVIILSASWDVLQFLVPIHGKQQGFSASQIGIVLGAFSIGSFVIRIALPWISQRVSEWPLILGSIGSAVLVYALYPFFSYFVAMIALSLLLGLGLGVAQPMVLSVIHRSAPEGRIGEAVGLRLMIIGASQVLLPLAFGALGSATGMAPLFWGMSVVALAGGIYVGRGHHEVEPAQRPKPDSKQDEGLL